MALLMIHQRPIDVSFECDNLDCEVKIEFTIKEFSEKFGDDMMSWRNMEITCPDCEHITEIDDWELD